MGVDISQEVVYGYYISEEEFDNLGDDLQDQLLDTDCWVMISPMYSSDGVFGIRLLNDFVELSLDSLDALKEELELLETPEYLNLENLQPKLYIFTQYS